MHEIFSFRKELNIKKIIIISLVSIIVIGLLIWLLLPPAKETIEKIEIYDSLGNKIERVIIATNEGHVFIGGEEVTEEEKIKAETNTTKEDLMQKIDTNMSYEIKDQNGEKIEDTDLIGTGTVIEFENGETYTIIIEGDVDGDGKLTANDLLRVKRHIVGIEGYEIEGVYKEAVDLQKDDVIDITDLLRIKRKVVGLENL